MKSSPTTEQRLLWAQETLDYFDEKLSEAGFGGGSADTGIGLDDRIDQLVDAYNALKERR